MTQKYEDLKILEYRNWTVYLNSNQSYLGWMYVLHKSLLDIDLFEISYDELEELHQIISSLRQCLNTLFAPDRFNYASLCNVFNRLHVHVIPRYCREVIFDEFQFCDHNWGKNYSPYDKGFKLDVKVLRKLKYRITEELCKLEH